jgi:hypothetical protein
MSPPDPERLRALQDDLRVWARDLPVQGSDRYGAVCAGLAEDPDRAALVLLARPGFQSPLILLAAVHHLLLTGVRHSLAAWYATVTGAHARPVDGDLYPTFAAFVDEHRGQLAELIASRTTQTNEVRRTVITVPALGLVQREADAPLALLEVGASAGLNLLVDRYGYRIGERSTGDPASSLQMACEVDGELAPPVPPGLAVAWRSGLDLNPLDVRDAAARDWLRALVWPEQPERLQLLDAALELARRDPPPIVRGDLVDDLPSVAGRAPDGAALTVVSTWTLAYLEAARRLAFLVALGRLATTSRRPVWLVAVEAESVVASLDIGLAEMPVDGFGQSTLSVHRFDPEGTREHRLLARVHPHGRWIRWADAATAVQRA